MFLLKCMYFAHAFMLTTAIDKWFAHVHLPCMVANEIGTKLASPDNIYCMAARTIQRECGWHVRSKCSWLHICEELKVVHEKSWTIGFDHACSEAFSSPIATGPINDGYMHWLRQNLRNIVCCIYCTIEFIHYPRDARADTVHASYSNRYV